MGRGICNTSLRIIFCLIALIGSGQILLGQIEVGLGISTIPLKIKRTDVYRMMTFPSFTTGFKINKKTTISALYLFQDIRQGKYPGDDPFIYTETPRLESYEEALKYKNSKFGYSEFYDYIFVGLKRDLRNTQWFNLQIGLQVGWRTGATTTLAYIVEHPGFPNGFEIRPGIIRSNGVGLNVFVKPKFLLSKFLSANISTGAFVFSKWPAFQPYLNLEAGILF